jgi:SpoVK/Ycf46/Vps4 family AAA+-type ATPase
MWNYLLYNQFCDKQINEMRETINKLKRKNFDLTEELSDNKETVNILKDKIYGSETNVKKIQQNDILKNEFTKVKRFKKSNKKNIKKMITNIYANLNSINDIIKLKNHPRKFDFIGNDKFNKLYNIIPALEELNNIIGMDNIKTQIFRSLCKFFYQVNSKHEMNHIMITGPPGVGKTTIATIMGKLYLQLGCLENDTFIVARRSDLIAKYTGQTADKTQKVIDSALGGVLFIDEVYSLGDKEQKDTFSKECIDTINLNMSRTDKPWLLIVCGYKEDIINSFLAFNKGLERRFTVELNIEGYNETELYNILLAFIKQEGWIIETDAITINDIIENKQKFKYYAGDMRKLFQLAKENYSVRMMKISITLKSIEKILVRDDFTNSISSFNNINDSIGFNSMYI